MKLKDFMEIDLLPADVDCECVSICNTLNRLPDVETFESCSGHGAHPFWVWFNCTNIDTLSRLGRAVDKNYSDGNWEIVVETSDTRPRVCFWLRAKSVLPYDDLLRSLDELEANILYWFQDEFDEHFKEE